MCARTQYKRMHWHYNRIMSHDVSAPKRRPDPEARIIGSRLRAVRDSLNLTQKDVAGRLGMSDGGYSSVERGHARMFVSDIPRFAKALGVESAYLARRLGLCGDEQPQFAESIMTNLGPDIGGAVMAIDRIAALLEVGDRTALTVLMRNTARKYEREEA